VVIASTSGGSILLVLALAIDVHGRRKRETGLPTYLSKFRDLCFSGRMGKEGSERQARRERATRLPSAREWHVSSTSI
jgi:hypothetical protein